MEMTSKQFVELLKQVVALYEKHPELPAPSGYSQRVDFYRADLTKEQIAAVAKAFPRVKKDYGSSTLTIQKNFYPKGVDVKALQKNWEAVPHVELIFACNREQVCERRVVGTKVVPAQEHPAYTTPERVEEIVEWKCNSILK